jgi:glucose-1-phosphate thymidylyltransferase
LFYGLDALAEAGLTEVGIIVGDTETEIREAVGDGSRWNMDVTFIRQDAPLGLAHAVLTAREFIDGDRFLMYLGDNFVRDDLGRFIQSFIDERADAQVFLVKVPHPERFGVATVEGDQVKKLWEKPRQPPSDLALTGVYAFNESIFEAASSIAPSARGELEITDALQWLIDHGYHVRAQHISEWWKDTGQVEDLLEANRFILEGKPAGAADGSDIHPSARISDSTIVPPVAIGPDCIIENATIGPYTSLGAGTRVTNTTISDSIVLEECRIENVESLERCLIGRSVKISEAPGDGVTLVVGDASRIYL